MPETGAAGWWEPNAYMRVGTTRSTGYRSSRSGPAAALARELRSEPGSPVVLHGDLRHETVLVQDDGTIVVLDPKGVLGPPGFDVAALLGNPVGRLAEAVDVIALVRGRIDMRAAELHRDRSWVASWGWVAAMLGEVRSAEAGQSSKNQLTVADAINQAGR